VFLTVDKPERSKFETAGRELNQFIERLGTVLFRRRFVPRRLCSPFIFHVPALETPIRLALKTLVAVRSLLSVGCEDFLHHVFFHGA